MVVLTCLDLIKNRQFDIEYYDYKKLKDFKRKCKYSKKLKIISQINWED